MIAADTPQNIRDRTAERFLGLPEGHFAAERAKKATATATTYALSVGVIGGFLLGRLVGLGGAGAAAGGLIGYTQRGRFAETPEDAPPDA